MSVVVQFGRPIPVGGKRPTWLSGKQDIGFRGASGWAAFNDWCADEIEGKGEWSDSFSRGWSDIVDIRLPANHFAYRALDAGFEPWGGGGTAPVDWDGDPRAVMLRNGDTEGNYALNWQHRASAPFGCEGDHDIIGYRKRVAPAELPDDLAAVAAMRPGMHLFAAVEPIDHAANIRRARAAVLRAQAMLLSAEADELDADVGA